MIALILIPLFSFLMRARGSQWYNLIPSTTVSRILAALGMGIGIGLASWNPWAGIIAAPLLYLWMIFGWDAYWSAEIGNDPAHSKGWGILYMAEREAYGVLPMTIIAILIGQPWRAAYALLFPLSSLVYYAYGAIYKPMAVEWSEYTIGAYLGFLFWLIIR